MPSSTPTSLSELGLLPLSSMAAAKYKARKQPGCKKSPVRPSVWPWTSRGDVATGHQPRLSHLWSSGKSDLPLASVWHRAICQRPWNRVRSATSSFLVMKALEQVTDLCKALLEIQCWIPLETACISNTWCYCGQPSHQENCIKDLEEEVP